MERYSNRELLKQKFGEAEKSTKAAKSTKRADKSVKKKGGKYQVKIVDGVKYMVLR